MLRYIRQLSKDTVIYGIGDATNKIIPFFLLPIFTRIFTPYEYGIIELLMTLVSFFSAFTFLGTSSSQTYYSFNKIDKYKKQDIFKTEIIFLAIWGGILTIICLISAYFIRGNFFNTNISFIYLVLTLLFGFFAVHQQNLVNIYRILFKPWTYIFISIFYTILANGLSLLLIVAFYMKVKGYIGGRLLAAFLIFFITLFMLKKWMNGEFSVKLLKKMLKYGIPLFPSSFGIWLINIADRWFINYYLDLKAVGIYAVGAKFGIIVSLVTQTFRKAWTPLAVSISKKADSNKFYNFIGKLYLSLGSIGSIIFTGVSVILIKVFIPLEYYPCYKVIGILVYAGVFYGFYTITGLGVWLKEKTAYVSIAIICSALINLILNAILIPEFNIIGAAIASLFSYIIGNLILLYFSEQIRRINLKLEWIILLFVITTGSILLQIYFISIITNFINLIVILIGINVVSIIIIISMVPEFKYWRRIFNINKSIFTF